MYYIARINFSGVVRFRGARGEDDEWNWSYDGSAITPFKTRKEAEEEIENCILEGYAFYSQAIICNYDDLTEYLTLQAMGV